MLGIAPESPASGARFVGQARLMQDSLTEKNHTTNLIEFYT